MLLHSRGSRKATADLRRIDVATVRSATVRATAGAALEDDHRTGVVAHYGIEWNTATQHLDHKLATALRGVAAYLGFRFGAGETTKNKNFWYSPRYLAFRWRGVLGLARWIICPHVDLRRIKLTSPTQPERGYVDANGSSSTGGDLLRRQPQLKMPLAARWRIRISPRPSTSLPSEEALLGVSRSVTDERANG